MRHVLAHFPTFEIVCLPNPDWELSGPKYPVLLSSEIAAGLLAGRYCPDNSYENDIYLERNQTSLKYNLNEPQEMISDLDFSF